MFLSVSYLEPDRWAHLAGSVASVGTSLLQGKVAALPAILLAGQPGVNYCVLHLNILQWALGPQKQLSLSFQVR